MKDYDLNSRLEAARAKAYPARIIQKKQRSEIEGLKPKASSNATGIIERGKSLLSRIKRSNKAKVSENQTIQQDEATLIANRILARAKKLKGLKGLK